MCRNHNDLLEMAVIESHSLRHTLITITLGAWLPHGATNIHDSSLILSIGLGFRGRSHDLEPVDLGNCGHKKTGVHKDKPQTGVSGIGVLARLRQSRNANPRV